MSIGSVFKRVVLDVKKTFSFVEGLDQRLAGVESFLEEFTGTGSLVAAVESVTSLVKAIESRVAALEAAATAAKPAAAPSSPAPAAAAAAPVTP